MNWSRSSYSVGNGACVEAGTEPDTVAVRDSKDATGPVLRFTPAQWRKFLDYARART
jgi:hypothetical protein